MLHHARFSALSRGRVAASLPGLVRQRQHSVVRAAAATLPRGVDRERPELSPGDELHGFRVERVEELPQFEATAIELLHTHTGARWLHLAADDTNNVFNVAFRTAPKDSSGVAHILEHTVLCGSERYPVRDPFFNMLKRSLASFMNAMTANSNSNPNPNLNSNPNPHPYPNPNPNCAGDDRVRPHDVPVLR